MSKTIKSAGIIAICCLILATTEIYGQLYEKYIGCFEDNENDQILEHVLQNMNDLSIDICIQKCYNETSQANSEMTFAALTNGTQCTCRNNSGQPLNDDVCNVRCSGSQSQNCGGNQTGNVYSLYTVCPVGHYGLICDQLCHCKRHSPCNRKTGICPDGCDEQWAGTNSNKSNIQKQYIGCYGDGNYYSNNAMDVKNPDGTTGQGRGNTNSNEVCIKICSTNNYTFAGMQYGYDCMCGEKYDRYGNKTHTGEAVNCTDPERRCPANNNEKCGGSFANSVYYVCPIGFYGQNCTKRCCCADGVPCRFKNGSCLTSTISSRTQGSACSSRARLSARQYMGCYKDNNTITAMKENFKWDGARNNTIESCTRHCASRNYMYAGLQYGRDCGCGNSYDRYGPLNESRCNMACSGNSSQICGGSFANSVYAAHDILHRCRNNTDCSVNETCNVIDLQYTNVSRCRCIQGFHRTRAWEPCTDLDECQADKSKCNATSENCFNNIGSYSCECKDGFRNISGNCEDINECQSGWLKSACNATSQDCLNSIGSYRCECKDGFMNISGNCVDIDECQSTCAASSENCFNNIGSYRCECRNGFMNVSGNCEDIDECRSDFFVCDNVTELCNNTIGGYVSGYENATLHNCTYIDDCRNGSMVCDAETELCKNTVGSYACDCKSGYENTTLGICTDIDECSNDSLVCDNETALCQNTIGSYLCQCKSGYENATSGRCTDIDECRSDDPVCNPATEKCINTFGSYSCECENGFANKSRYCVDIDECQSGNSTCSQTTEVCVNSIGSYRCECNDGFVKLSGKCEDNDECRNGFFVCDIETQRCTNTFGSYSCDCKPGYDNTTFDNCTDVDECQSGNSTCNPSSENCVNNIGSYSCECKNGFAKLTGMCEDVDECKSDNSTCNLTSEKCANNIGSYRCICNNGFANISGNCQDIDECQSENAVCNPGTEKCINNIGSYNCECKDGFVNKSRHCVDIDECELKSTAAPCNTLSEYCNNSIGSYTCTCMEGFTKRSGKCEDEQNGAVVISLVCLLVIIIIAALVAVCLLRKRIFAKKANNENTASDANAKSQERKISGDHKETFIPLMLRNQINNKIPVGLLPALFKTKKSQPGTLEAEFKSIPEDDSTKTCFEGKRKELKHRNRFLNIIPYDQNRVTLEKHHKQFSDYINASFIKSYSSQEKLIATQGPNPDTLTHFWQMIYENNVGTVVMITNLIENGKKKCARYWPEYDGSMTFEDMTITLKSTECWPNYVIRHLQLIKGKTSMDITQWHFTVWPDHGAPADVKGFLNFRRSVRQSMSYDKYTIVHCSAGVGRTGTFIAINYLLEQAEAEGLVDIVGCLTLLRQQRIQMVQTLDQYEFIYAALATEFTLGKTTISVQDFDRAYRDLLVRSKLSGKTQLEIHFQVLQEQWAQQSDSENPLHVFAKSQDMSELSDVVKAVFVQSWRSRDAYIVPEYPGKSSVNYFWTICLDYECKLIVYLDNGQNSSLFFPTQLGESLCVDSWKVNCTSSESEQYGTRLCVSLTQFSESEYANTAVSTANGEVTLLNVKAYVNDARLNYDAVYSTYNSIKTLESKNGEKKSNTPVFIVSRPNCVLSGLFIAAFNAFDMLDEAKEVDLYQVVNDIKKSRSKFIPSLATYEELHNIVNNRIGSTSSTTVYSNA